MAAAQVPSWSLEAQRRLLGGPSLDAARDVAELQRLAREGEAQLERGDANAAQAALDRAAAIVHSPDIEIALVRAYMQAGNYRQALAFAAHAAGAHRNVASGTALYAWLLHSGGQGVYARRLLDDALERTPQVSVLVQARALLNDPAPTMPAALMQPPLRAAPYAWPAGLASAASVVGTAVLVAEGAMAVVPAPVVAGARRIWVRNGLGQTVTVLGAPQPGSDGLVWLTLASALPYAQAVQASARDPFPGSPTYCIEYMPSQDGGATWPLLFQGFVGRWLAAPNERLLGLDMPRGPRGGPVFDKHGRLAGMAVPGWDGRDRFVSISRLTLPGATSVPSSEAAPAQSGQVQVDQVYETSLRLAVQVLVER